ncbi:extracellular solute-binding protein [Kitasatospora sp. CB01950]|uniref:extracellular solute-binding protein n=1 Tax=Kitasatospora sp. CB01950 TaxID=1703930 RepID=UPI00093BF368|nr:extracellular solute-binding protein [Kitasatospora sp. CB01950]OKJ15637.1 hypothetical protein AMK19_04955 [Kitasatospora sp. CB01950]
MSRNPSPATAAALAASLAAVLLVSSCGVKNSGGAQHAQGGSAADVVSAAKAQGQVDYWSTWGEKEPQAAIFKAAADDFTAQTGIKVNIKYLGRSGTTTMPQAIASGSGPDMFDSGTDHIAAFAGQQWLSAGHTTGGGAPELGYASAMATLLTVLTVALVVLVRRLGRSDRLEIS